MAEITKEQVEHVANLARLTFDNQEIDLFTNQMADIIDFAEQLNQLDTEGVEPTTHVLDIKNVLRKDTPRKWLTREEALKNTPDQKDGQIKVPSMIE
jgi:aspartyl-tRNA(Asn)/glutamyl-tRNA(Gln) amidotransferase subunit C